MHHSTTLTPLFRRPKNRSVAVALYAVLTAVPPLHAQSTTTPSDVPARQHFAAWATARYTYQPSLMLSVPRPDSDAPEALTYAVAVGDWPTVAAELATLPPAGALQVYRQIAQSLVQDKPGSPFFISPKDVFALAETLPATIDIPDADLPLFGQLLSKSLKSTNLSADVLASLKAGTPHFGGTDSSKRIRLGTILFFAGKPTVAAPYLPSVDDVMSRPDTPMAALVYRNTLAAMSEVQPANDTAELNRLRQAALMLGIARLNTPRISEGSTALVGDIFALCESDGDFQKLLGWLNDLRQSQSPHLGVALLRLAKMPSPEVGNARTRINALTLQRQVADLLLQDDASTFAPGTPRQIALELLAANWTAEADLTGAGFLPSGPGQRVPTTFGSATGQTGSPDVLSAQQLLLLRPGDRWVETLRPENQLALRQALIPVAMHADEIDLAMQTFGPVAGALPDSLDTIGGNALSVWAQKHAARRLIRMTTDVNKTVAAGIPLTRREQDRNLQVLVSMLDHLATIYGRRLSPSELPALFTTIYSQAEVFQLSDIEKVFGPLEKLDSDMAIALATLMQKNLETIWQDPIVQNAFGTGLNADEIAARVKAGYVTVLAVLRRQSSSSHDSLVDFALAKAAFSQSNYLLAQKASLSDYIAARQSAFDAVHRAAAEYAAGVSSVASGNESVDLYSLWFAMAMGTADVTKPEVGDTIDRVELGQLSAALHALPGDAARRHIERFTLALNEHLKSLPKENKQEILRASLPIVGHTPLSWPITSLVHLYDDLLGDIRLNVTVDGSTQIGAGQPFGVVVALEHTERLEHEVGSFNKYTINELNGAASNGDSPPVNYRERLERHIRMAMFKGFDVLDLTWAPDDVHSYLSDRPGWRKTPLVYVTAKAKDASVDTIAPVQIDLDFNDNLNQVILPVESPDLMLDAKTFTPRPTGKLTIEQIINDRDMAAGKLLLTVRATGTGIMPSLDRLIDLKQIDGFTVEAIQDDGLKSDRFQTVPVRDGSYVSNPQPTVASEHAWTVTLQAKPSPGARTTFHFPAILPEFNPSMLAAVNYFRLSDADVQSVDSSVAIQGFNYGTTRLVWPWVLGITAAVLVAAGGITGLIFSRRRPVSTGPQPHEIKADTTLFAALALLRSIEVRAVGTLESKDGTSLREDIRILERHYFQRPGSDGTEQPGVDVNRLVRKWRS